MMPLHDYLQGLAETAATIVSGCGSLWLAWRIVRFAHLNRVGQ